MKKVGMVVLTVVIAIMAIIGSVVVFDTAGAALAGFDVPEEVQHIGGVTEGVRVRDMERNGVKYTLFFNEDGYLVDVERHPN